MEVSALWQEEYGSEVIPLASNSSVPSTKESRGTEVSLFWYNYQKQGTEDNDVQIKSSSPQGTKNHPLGAQHEYSRTSRRILSEHSD